MARLDFSLGRRRGVSFIRFFLEWPVGGEVIENRDDLFRRQIRPIRHALLLKVAEELSRSGIAGLNDARRPSNETEQPFARAALGDALEIGPHFDSLSKSVATGAALAEDGFRFVRGVRRRRKT